MHFIVGPFGSGRQKIFKKLIGTLRKLPASVIGDGIGGTAGQSMMPDLDSTSLQHCLYQIRQKLVVFEGLDHYVFTGTGLSMHIKKIMAEYPDAALYMVRRTNAELELTAVAAKFDVTEEWITASNAQVRADHEAYADELGIPWKLVNTPVFTVNNTPNWAPVDEPSDTDIEMACYNQ